MWLLSKKLKLCMGLILLSGLASCTTKPYVEIDYQENYSFAGLVSFSVLEAKQDIKENILISPFTLSHIHSALEANLGQRYKKAEGDRGDFEVRYHVVIEEKLDPQSFDTLYGFGFYSPLYRRYPSPFFHGPNTGLRVYNQGSLIIDIVDAKTDKPIWRGVSEKRLSRSMSPQQQRVVLSKAVAEVVAQFPPVE